jgi:hypothetical protein
MPDIEHLNLDFGPLIHYHTPAKLCHIEPDYNQLSSTVSPLYLAQRSLLLKKQSN